MLCARFGMLSCMQDSDPLEVSYKISKDLVSFNRIMQERSCKLFLNICLVMIFAKLFCILLSTEALNCHSLEGGLFKSMETCALQLKHIRMAALVRQKG